MDEAARTRALVRQRGVNKMHGCSWIAVQAQVHEFHASIRFPFEFKRDNQVLVCEMMT